MVEALDAMRIRMHEIQAQLAGAMQSLRRDMMVMEAAILDAPSDASVDGNTLGAGTSEDS